MQAKGYRVGPVYDDVLAMAWFFLELIVKSMALEKTRLFYHTVPTGIFKILGNLFMPSPMIPLAYNHLFLR